MVDWKGQIQKAVALCGSQKRLADGMGCSQAKVNWLLKTAKQISADDALAIQRATAGRVSATSMRPDLVIAQ